MSNLSWLWVRGSSQTETSLRPATATLLPPSGNFVCPMSQHASDEANSVVLEPDKQTDCHHHNCPAALAFFIGENRSKMLTGMPEVTASLVKVASSRSIQAFADTEELQTSGNDHDAQKGCREALQQVDQSLSEQDTNDKLQQSEEDNTSTRARSEAVLCS